MVEDPTDADFETFARRVFDLVETVGRVSAWTTGIEFHWVIQVRPHHPAVSLAFDILLNELYLVVESPKLGWWTFEWDSTDEAWQVIEQLVSRGGIVYRRSAWTGASELRDLNDQLVSGPHINGGLRLRKQRAIYLPYSKAQ